MYEHILTTCWSSLEEPCKDHLSTKGGYQEAARAGLKVNAVKSFFCTQKKILSYILIREGIKPRPKKVQAILALDPPYM
jgi:hypothetical protein